MDVTSRRGFKSRDCELTTVSYLNNLSEKTKGAVRYLWVYGNKITSLSGLESFTNLYYINLYGNSLTNVNGLKNSNKIEYLRLADNVFTDNDVKQNNDTDSLYVLQNLSKLTWLDISTNSGIKYISYLESLSKLKYLYMDGCSNLANEDVLAMRSKIIGMSEKTYDSKYEKILINPSNQTLINYFGETVSVSEFKIIGECTKLTHLNLRNTKVVKGTSESLAESENTVEKLMASVFKNLTNLQYLTLNGLTVQLDSTPQKISDITFLPTNLIVLDLQNTDVIARGNTENEANKLNDTKNTLSIKNSDKLNNLTRLRAIIINTENFNFSKLQDMLNRFDLNTNYKFPDWTWGDGLSADLSGLNCSNWVSFKTLEKCSEITELISYSRLEIYAAGTDKELNLSNCNKLKYVKTLGWNNFTVNFPSSIKTINKSQFPFDDLYILLHNSRVLSKFSSFTICSEST